MSEVQVVVVTDPITYALMNSPVALPVFVCAVVFLVSFVFLSGVRIKDKRRPLPFNSRITMTRNMNTKFAFLLAVAITASVYHLLF